MRRLILAQLPNRGGHRAYVRIAPDAVPGYIAALRETNTATDGAAHDTPTKEWGRKLPGAKHPHDDGHIEESLNMAVSPDVVLVPIDFINIGFAGVEEELCSLVTGTDEWASFHKNICIIPWRDSAVLSTRQVSLETWWGRYQPILHVAIEPWSMFYMDGSQGDFSMELPTESLRDSPKRGTSKQRILSSESLMTLTNSKDGGQRVAQSYCGLVRRHGDFAARELAIARFLFQVIDFINSIPISESLMRSTGNIENVARNQCDVLRLAAGILRGEEGRKKRVSDRGRLFSLTQELHRVEIKKTLLATEALKEGCSLGATIAKSNARDVSHSSRDRDFRTLGFPVSTIFAELPSGCLIIFDADCGTNEYDASVHLFSNSVEDNGTYYIDVIAHRRHMR